MSTDARLSLLFALADDELILGHRLSEWTGWVPYVEEDLALSSVAQDEIAHARMLYEIASTIDGRDVDALALGRAPAEYRSAWICERPNRDFVYTVARQWLYDNADDVRLRALRSSSFKEMREASEVMLLEEQYHLEHANAWFSRLANGPVDARHRLAEALEQTAHEALGLFEELEREDELRADGTLPVSSSELQAEWVERTHRALETAGLEHVLAASRQDGTIGEMVPTSSGAIEGSVTVEAKPQRSGIGYGGRRGEHSEDFKALWAEMTSLYREHPGARW